MIPYAIFVFIVLLFYRKKQYIGIMVVMTLFSIIRYDVGWDYMSYYEVALDPESYHDYFRFSFFWQKIYLLAYNYHIPSFAISFPSLLICLFTFWGIYLIQDGNRRGICDALIIYILWPFFYLGSFSTIRQSLAVSVCLLIYGLIRKERYILAILFFVFNYFIHPSSVVSILIVPIILLKYNINVKTSIITILVGISCLSLVYPIVSMLGTYMRYVEGEADYGKNLSVLLILIGSWILFSKYKIERKGHLLFYGGIVAIAVFLEASIYLCGLASVVARILNYFSILMIFVMTDSVRYINPKLVRPMLALFAILFFWYLNHSVAGEASSGFVPYKSILF